MTRTLENPAESDLLPARGECRSGFRTTIVCFILFAGTFLLFSRAIGFGFLDYDDPNYVTQNIHVQTGFTWVNIRWAFTTGHAANWHPVTWLSHMLDWKLYGNRAAGHHATNILLHSLNGVLAFLAFRRLTGAFWTSALCAAIFAWHPLRVESVVWISERKDVLSGFFGLATIWMYAVYAQKKRAGGSVLFYLLTLLLFSIGLLCKPMLVTMPCVLLLLDFWPLGRAQSLADCIRLILEKIPFFLLSAGSSVVTYHVQKAGGAIVETLGLYSRLTNSAVSVALYLENFFWPFGLAVGYPYPDRWPSATVAISVLLLAGISIVALIQIRRRSWIFVGWLWYLGMLVPVIGIVKVGLQGMADRYTYLPMLGVELAILWTLREFFRSANTFWIKVIASLLLAGCIARTWNQVSLWQDQHTLYGHALEVTKDNFLADCYLGSILVNDGRLDEARFHFQRAIDIKPDYADARCKLGLVLERTGHPDEAAAQYRRVLRDRPDDAKAHYSLGVLLLKDHEPADAIAHLEIALREDPDDDAAWLAAGMADSDLNQNQQAIDCFEHALRLNPTNAEAHYDFANALDSLDREPEALAQYDQAIQLNPSLEDAHNNKANLLRKLGRPADACAEYRKAIVLDSKDANAYFGLGAALEDLGREEDARKCYEQAVQIRPAFADAQYNLGAMLLNDGHADSAIPHFRAAVRAQNDYEPAFLGLGLAENQLSHPQEAIVDLQQAVALNADDADAHFYLGTILNASGKRADAMVQWRQVQRINPNYPGLGDQLLRAAATNPTRAPAGGN